ncbi:MAG TPA: hypothetical protein VFB38_01305 [Chthonomonadaceae bacterium]|nr:hypothetical protein [Chthonomonadaceae bacterium]
MRQETGAQQALFTALAQRREAFQAAKREWSARLLRPTEPAARMGGILPGPTPDQNVVGVAIGEKVTRGKPTGIPALKFLVQVKYPDAQIAARERLPKVVDGLVTDVEQVGRLRRLVAAPPAVANPRARLRPAPPGCSIGFRDPKRRFVMAGTFGALVRDDQGAQYILSNNHVLADENQLPLGSPIYQPGLLDGGRVRRDKIATLTRFVPLQTDGTNQADCAIARALNNSLVTNAILEIGPPQGTTAAAIDMVVHKFGRTTSYTVGHIVSADADVKVDYDTGQYVFAGQMLVVGLNNQPFSDAGDSGSLIVERSTGQAVGLLFAGSSSHTIANPIETALSLLNVTLA